MLVSATANSDINEEKGWQGWWIDDIKYEKDDDDDDDEIECENDD